MQTETSDCEVERIASAIASTIAQQEVYSFSTDIIAWYAAAIYGHTPELQIIKDLDFSYLRVCWVTAASGFHGMTGD